MANITITRELGADRDRYIGTVEGVAGEAELTYSHAEPARVVADHTFTPDKMRGQGVATALVERLVADARREGFRIVPLCPFVKAQFDRHPEWSDLRA
ncbi:MAG: GNAT family N-acetyltransferase [Steroidobacteraceae bacterium]